ncbi:MAG: hypothetical protein PVH16_05900 [Thioalkalispiraceae bacterium]|jgi:type II secretory pathway component HofQ
MNILKRYTFLVFIISSLLQGPVYAQKMDLDIIDLQHRSAEEVIPLLQPFLAPEAVVTARGYKLIIKSTPANLVEIRELIAELDTPLRQLLITVSIGRHEQQQAQQTEAEVEAEIHDKDVSLGVQSADEPAIEDTTTMGSIVRGEKKTDTGRISAKVKTRKTTTQRDKPVHQTIRSSEGQWATIHTGQAVPIVERTRNPDGTVTQTIRYHSATTGFSVLPRLQANNRVTLYIRPSQTTPSEEGGGKFDIQSIETTIEGNLGEWIALGSLSELSRHNGSAIMHSTRSRSERQDNVFVKIETVQ